MSIPQPSLSSVKGVLVLVVAVALATSLLTNTGIGRTIQGTLDGLADKVPA
jgi:hypothetical protein